MNIFWLFYMVSSITIEKLIILFDITHLLAQSLNGL